MSKQQPIDHADGEDIDRLLSKRLRAAADAFSARPTTAGDQTPSTSPREGTHRTSHRLLRVPTAAMAAAVVLSVGACWHWLQADPPIDEVLQADRGTTTNVEANSIEILERRLALLEQHSETFAAFAEVVVNREELDREKSASLLRRSDREADTAAIRVICDRGVLPKATRQKLLHLSNERGVPYAAP